MEQIVDYKLDPGNGYNKTLLCFMQLFIVSNRDRTYYFANNNARHFAFNADERFLPIYEFAAEDNRKIAQLDEFAESLPEEVRPRPHHQPLHGAAGGRAKAHGHAPYQVYAVQHIIKCIDENNGNGYIWHTTGSGKTLTSFKASTLLKENEHIHKCVFVVDRKDLDRQTREEFNKFQEGCVEENQHRRPRAPPAVTTTPPTRSSSPPSRSSAWRWTRTARATSSAAKTAPPTKSSSGAAGQAHRLHL